MTMTLPMLSGKYLISLVAVATSVSAFIFDWNRTQLFNPAWPQHAHFHDAQTMFLGLGLAVITLTLLWTAPARIVSAWFTASLYWLAFLFACVAPETSLDDPGYRIPHPGGIPANLSFGLVMLVLAAVGLIPGRKQPAAVPFSS